jgi:hypothetical protein
MGLGQSHPWLIKYSAHIIQNKTLSDDTDEILRLQGVGWLKRRAIALATITLYVKHYKDESGVEHIDIDQKLTGGITGSSEIRILDWTSREHDDSIYGPLVGKSRRVKLDEIENEYLKKGWLQDTEQHGAINAYAQSDTPKSGTSWTADQVQFRCQNPSLALIQHLGRLDLGI